MNNLRRRAVGILRAPSDFHRLLRGYPIPHAVRAQDDELVKPVQLARRQLRLCDHAGAVGPRVASVAHRARGGEAEALA
eukprot:CAMPEP_0182841116 /NCGR_PEP_ID=MMETSP0006_2-20121128/24845_1 /TAXON_ID=97485 /ORGANISM="Prymnesium parvum, Strain Texoma1" /LENGTH=78 /DNA_ID=CAMNT_0024970545 /DNA_START=390 /DNA_END=622 /DNA_ORIENTATION=-